MTKQATRKLYDYADSDETVDDPGETSGGGRQTWENDDVVRVLTPRHAETHVPELADTKKPLGRRLREAREALGLSVKEVADRLYLENKVIAALEADDHDQLPASIFVQGYIRSYAKILELPPENLLKIYYQQYPSKHPPLSSTAAPSHAVQSGSSRDTWYRALTLLILLGLTVLVVMWWLNLEKSTGTDLPLPALPGNTTAPAEPPLPAPTPGGTAIPLPQPGTGGPAVAEFTPPAEGEQTPGETPAAGAPAETPPPVPAAPPPDPNSFKLSLSKDSWVEITDAKGTKLYKRTARAGENLSLTGTAPFKFILRHADAVTLEYQNKVVDLSSYKGDRSARFTLGPEGIQ